MPLLQLFDISGLTPPLQPKAISKNVKPKKIRQNPHNLLQAQKTGQAHKTQKQ